MSNLSCFLKKNAKAVETIKYVASSRYTENGKPIEWEIKPVSADMDEAIRKECTKYVVVGKRGQRTPELDVDKYAEKLCAACTVVPNLNSAELQDDYGVKGAGALLKAMLCIPGEYTDYKAKVMEVNGYNVSFEELVEDAKN